MKRIKALLSIFLSMMKIGLFTFGGGYAMINLLENEFVKRKSWIDSDEFCDLVTIAESTPGPIAINCATYIGYKKERMLGSVLATLGMCVPSFVIIFLISMFFDSFLELSVVNAAFRGIQVCVVYLIASAGFKMLKKIKKTAFNISVMVIVLVAMLSFSLLSIHFSSILYILIFGFIGLSIFTVGFIKEKKSGEAKKK